MKANYFSITFWFNIYDNHEKLSISHIDLQYNADKVELEEFSNFKEKVLNLYESLTNNGVQILHTAICMDIDIEDKDALKSLVKNTINPKLYTKDLIDASLKFGKKHEDLFYKIITILNKKQLKINEMVDEKGRSLPIPLVSWYDSKVEKELINIQYEINDKYSYDFTKNYHTTEFYLNKMLYLLENDLQSDIDNLLNKGEF